MSFEKHPLHIKDPELQKSDEVSSAVEKQERLEDEKVPNDPSPRIEAYMDRLENIFLNPNEDTRKRNIEMFRDKIYDSLLIKPENFPDSYFELQKRIARERGQVAEEIPENIREQMINTAIEDQRASLDAWIDYLSSDDAVYPTWFKYYVWKNITRLSQFDKERGEFKKRTSSTVAPFPDIYREPLAQIADAYEKVKEDNKNLKDEEVQELFSKKFPTIYGELIQKTLEQQVESNEEIKGEWVKYEKGNMEDAEKLFQSLENKGTGWCTAGHSTAKTQIESGDFYVYYTADKDGAQQPRIAIRMQGNQIGEVRGILPHQNLEPIMQGVLEEKLKDFGSEAESYQKKSEDMKRLTLIEQKDNESLSAEDLIFLYEIKSKIKGFGYGDDPRIQEIRNKRDKNNDYLLISDYVLDNSEQFSKEIIKRAKDTKHLNELYGKHKQNEPFTIKDIRFLYALDQSIDSFGEGYKIVHEIKTGRKKEEDARILSERTNEIENKIDNSIPLNKADFEYLFEINQKIETFLGVSDYYRIARLRQKSDIRNHLDVMFECEKEQIAYSPEQINENTRVWLGKITIDILAKLPDTVTHIHQDMEKYDWESYHSYDQAFYRLKHLFKDNLARFIPDERKFVTLESKIKNKETLNRDELISLYSIDGNIYHFASEGRDDLEKLRRGRDIEKDMLVIFECSKEEVAHNNQEINENTKAYVGSLEPGVFQKLPKSVEYIYSKFPEFRVTRDHVSIGGKPGEKLITDLETSQIIVEDNAKYFLKKSDIFNDKDTRDEILINLPAGVFKELFDSPEVRSGYRRPLFTSLIDRARRLGLEFCSKDTAPYYVLNRKNQVKKISRINVCTEPLINQKDEKSMFVIYPWHNFEYKGPFIGTSYPFGISDWERFLFRLSKK